MSLALNSREAMPDGGVLTIRAENAVMRDPASPSSRAVGLTVTDTGRGMAREVTAHAFEPFFTTKAVSGHGVGLGLATVYGIVTNARGKIELDVRAGPGHDGHRAAAGGPPRERRRSRRRALRAAAARPCSWSRTPTPCGC